MRGHLVIRQQMPQRRRRALVEQDAHLRRSQGASGCVLQHSACLFKRDTGEQGDHFADRYTVFEVFEQGGNRHSRTAEYPGSANTFRVAFHHRTGSPINHANDGSTGPL